MVPYEAFTRKRRGGGRLRMIHAPDPVLMGVQRWILKRSLVNVRLHDSAFAYRSGRSVSLCARRHLNANWLLKSDLHNFFGTVTEIQAFKIFESLSYSRLVSFELARLCTLPGLGPFPIATRQYIIEAYGDRHPGVFARAPTSGALANAVALDLDNSLQDFAISNRLAYTRYADDLVFSSSDDFNRAKAANLTRLLRRTIREQGFIMHEKKTRIVPPGARQDVLGVVLTKDGLRLSREVRAKLNQISLDANGSVFPTIVPTGNLAPF